MLYYSSGVGFMYQIFRDLGSQTGGGGAEEVNVYKDVIVHGAFIHVCFIKHLFY